MSIDMKGPGKSVEYKPGPVHSSPVALALWLEQAAGDKPRSVWLQIPITVELSSSGLSRVASVSLGFNQSPKVDLRLDDTMMGISFEERIEEHCAKRKGTCELWIQGHWGAVVSLPGDTGRAFSVRHIHGLKRPGDKSLQAFVGR